MMKNSSNKINSDYMKNDIICDSRIVSDHTYAVRYLSFLGTIYPNVPSPTCSAMDEEEYEFMCRVACDLLRLQVDIEPRPSEVWYFENLVPGYECAKDIIKKHICKLHPEFYNFLKVIKAI